MGEFINKHSIKIQVGVFLSFIVFVVTIALYVGGFVRQVQANAEAINKYVTLFEKIPVLETNVAIIKEDLKDIKTDIKSLLKSK